MSKTTNQNTFNTRIWNISYIFWHYSSLSWHWDCIINRVWMNLIDYVFLIQEQILKNSYLNNEYSFIVRKNIRYSNFIHIHWKLITRLKIFLMYNTHWCLLLTSQLVIFTIANRLPWLRTPAAHQFNRHDGVPFISQSPMAEPHVRIMPYPMKSQLIIKHRDQYNHDCFWLVL